MMDQIDLPCASKNKLLALFRCRGVIGLLVVIACLSGCSRSHPHYPRKNRESDIHLKDVTETSGIHFDHFNGGSGEFYFCELVGPGAALFDYDNDGDLDLYVVQGAMLGPNKSIDEAIFPPKCQLPPRDALFRNDLMVCESDNKVAFVDVSSESGINGSGYGMGVATGDYDNDGWIDIYVTNFGENQLLKNKGDGTFQDVTKSAGVGDHRWNTSASFLDFDRDGHLDLFVCGYVNFSLQNHRPCFTRGGARDYCGPLAYDPLPDRLFRNRGDGTFEDVSARSRIATAFGGALGVTCADFNADGWPDIYVANDGLANQCWMNKQDGTFENSALLAGCAFNGDGVAEASMGVVAADFDNDGDEDLFMAHLSRETNTFYENDGQGNFSDSTKSAGLATPSQPFTGFGTACFDADNDGWLDLLVVNGAVKTIEKLAARGDPFPLHQKNQFFHNVGRGRFRDVTHQAGSVFQQSEVSRAAAVGDLDNDGDSDVVTTQNNGPVRVILNKTQGQNNWLGLRLVGKDAPRDMLGASVRLSRSGQSDLMRRVKSDGSYCSSRDSRVLFGLGKSAECERVVVEWPSGRKEQWQSLEVNTYHQLTEGSGQDIPSN